MAGIFQHNNSICIFRPLRSRRAAAHAPDALYVFRVYVPLRSVRGSMRRTRAEKMCRLRKMVSDHRRTAHKILQRLRAERQARAHLPPSLESSWTGAARACRRPSHQENLYEAVQHDHAVSWARHAGRADCRHDESTCKKQAGKGAARQ